MSINTDESDLSEDNDTKSTNRLDFLNNLLMLLLNSDIQQCAEKASIKKIPNEIDFVDVNDLRKEAIAKIFDHLNARLDYLPIKWQMTELNSIMDNSMSTLQLYNLDIAVHAAQSMINTLKLSDLPTGLDDILGFTTTKSKIESAMEQLQYMPYVSYDKDLSQKIKRASDYWKENINVKINEITQKSKDPEDLPVGLVDDLSNSFKKWKKIILETSSKSIENSTKLAFSHLK